MKNIKHIVLMLCFLTAGFIFGQVGEKTPSFFENSFEDSKLSSVQMARFNLSQIENNNSNFNSGVSNNQILLTQIGELNEIIINSNTISSQKIIQKGDENYYHFKDYKYDPSVNLGVLQRGNANSLSIDGANSMLNNAVIIQTRGARLSINSY